MICRRSIVATAELDPGHGALRLPLSQVRGCLESQPPWWSSRGLGRAIALAVRDDGWRGIGRYLGRGLWARTQSSLGLQFVRALRTIQQGFSS